MEREGRESFGSAELVTKGYLMELRENQFEHALVYDRRDGRRVEIALTHLSGMEPVLQAAIFHPDQQEEPATISPAFSLAEVKYHYEFYCRLKEAGILDQSS